MMRVDTPRSNPVESASVLFGRGQRPAPAYAASAAAIAANSELPAAIAARLDPTLLTPSMGSESLASGLDRSVRFLLEGEGTLSQRTLVPETRMARLLLASTAGPKLERILRGYLASADSYSAATQLRGIVLAPDIGSLRANEVLSAWHRALDRTEPNTYITMNATSEAAADSLVAGMAERLIGGDAAIAGAWAQDGWITFLPKATHVMMTAANAATIDLSDRPGGKPKLLERTVDWLRDIGAHELQHAVTPTDGRDRSVPWEEGTAEVISHGISQLQAERTGLTADRFRAALSQPDEFDTGWAPYVEPPAGPHSEERDRRIREVYAWPERALKELLAVAGVADTTSPKGWTRANELLQAPSDESAQLRITAAILATNSLSPTLANQVGSLVRAAVEYDGGQASIDQLHQLIATATSPRSH